MRYYILKYFLWNLSDEKIEKKFLKNIINKTKNILYNFVL